MTTLEERVAGSVIEDRDGGLYRCRRDIFTDEELFELEMKHIFEGNWIYLAHESQIPNRNDYLTLTMGRQPVFITRDRHGRLSAFINACSHRGAMLCRRKRGTRAIYTCPFHGWTFANTGELLKVKDPDQAGYPPQFNTDGSHNLKPVPRFENYRGFLFGSLNPEVAPFSEYLGEACKIIDLMVDQAPEGLEVLRGSSTYYYDGNWKLQAENGADGYHVSSVHWNYVMTTSRRNAAVDDIKAIDASSWNRQEGGFYAFENGHICLWTQWADPTTRPVYERLAELTEQYGEARANWMVRYLRNLCIYPNVFLMDQFSSQIRVFRPVAVDRTEVTIYCIAPKDEPPEQRARRIRQYEDFFNASGMATPDDLEEFRACQNGYRASAMPWNDMSRGAEHWIRGPDHHAKSLGIDPLMSGVRTEDEGLFTIQHAHWAERMRVALEAEARVDGVRRA